MQNLSDQAKKREAVSDYRFVRAAPPYRRSRESSPPAVSEEHSYQIGRQYSNEQLVSLLHELGESALSQDNDLAFFTFSAEPKRPLYIHPTPEGLGDMAVEHH